MKQTILIKSIIRQVVAVPTSYKQIQQSKTHECKVIIFFLTTYTETNNCNQKYHKTSSGSTNLLQANSTLKTFCLRLVNVYNRNSPCPYNYY